MSQGAHAAAPDFAGAAAGTGLAASERLAATGGALPSSRPFTCSTNCGDGSAPGMRVHCTRRNSGGTPGVESGVSSTTTGTRNGTPSIRRCVCSTASFHSSRKYPLPRSSVFLDMIGTKSVHASICLRIFWSQASPPRSSLWSNHTSTPLLRRASAIRLAAAVSSRA